MRVAILAHPALLQRLLPAAAAVVLVPHGHRRVGLLLRQLGRCASRRRAACQGHVRNANRTLARAHTHCSGRLRRAPAARCRSSQSPLRRGCRRPWPLHRGGVPRDDKCAIAARGMADRPHERGARSARVAHQCRRRPSSAGSRGTASESRLARSARPPGPCRTAACSCGAALCTRREPGDAARTPSQPKSSCTALYREARTYRAQLAAR